jgi:hypothetical protein
MVQDVFKPQSVRFHFEKRYAEGLTDTDGQFSGAACLPRVELATCKAAPLHARGVGCVPYDRLVPLGQKPNSTSRQSPSIRELSTVQADVPPAHLG